MVEFSIVASVTRNGVLFFIFLKQNKMCCACLQVFFSSRDLLFSKKIYSFLKNVFKSIARWTKDFLPSRCSVPVCVRLRVTTLDADFILRSGSGFGYLGLVNWLNPLPVKDEAGRDQ